MGPGKIIGVVMQMCYAPLDLYAQVLFFFSVWDYVPVLISNAGHVAVPLTSDVIAVNARALIAWTQVHAIFIKTCVKTALSEAIDD